MPCNSSECDDKNRQWPYKSKITKLYDLVLRISNPQPNYRDITLIARYFIRGRRSGFVGIRAGSDGTGLKDELMYVLTSCI